jgi:hypothetical protein
MELAFVQELQAKAPPAHLSFGFGFGSVIALDTSGVGQINW